MDDDTIIEVAAAMVGAHANNTYRKDACAEVSYYYPEIDQDILVYMWMAIDAWVDAHPEDK